MTADKGLRLTLDSSDSRQGTKVDNLTWYSEGRVARRVKEGVLRACSMTVVRVGLPLTSASSSVRDAVGPPRILTPPPWGAQRERQ